MRNGWKGQGVCALLSGDKHFRLAGGRLLQIAVSNSAVLWDLKNKLNWSCLTPIVAHLLCIRLLGTNS